MKHAILLCDYGLDDAVATVALLKYKEKFDGIDILPIGGNVPERVAFDNAKRLLAVYSGKLDGVRIVDTSSVMQPAEYLKDIHGEDGMGSLFSLPESIPVPLLYFADWINTVRPESSVLISLGPCTVTQIILEQTGAMEMLLMGGHVNARPNYKGYEFNYGINPQAFAACLKFPHTVATLDTCHIKPLDYFDNNPMTDPLMKQLVDRIRQLDAERDFKKTCVYDYIAVGSLIFPDRYITESITDPFGNSITQLKYVCGQPLIM